MKKRRRYRRASDAMPVAAPIVRAPELFLSLLRRRVRALSERGGVRESVLADLRDLA